MFATLNNQDLLMRTRDLVERERAMCAQLMLHLGEVDARKLYADEGYPSMFKFMVDGLKYSEPAAVRRLAAARLSRRYPEILNLLKEGRIHLTALHMLAKVLSDANAERLLGLCGGKSKIQIEAIILQETGELVAPKREVVRVVPAAVPSVRPAPREPQPRALGGSNDMSNIRLLCRSHNLLAARTLFGTEFMDRHLRGTGKDR